MSVFRCIAAITTGMMASSSPAVRDIDRTADSPEMGMTTRNCSGNVAGMSDASAINSAAEAVRPEWNIIRLV